MMGLEKPIVKDGFTHALCVGEIGSGKTTGFILPNIEDRISKGYGALIFDYKGNLGYSVKHIAKQNNRLFDILEIGAPWGESVNPLLSMNPKDIEKFVLKMFEGGVDYVGENHFWNASAAKLFVNIFEAQKCVNTIFELIKADDMTFYSSQKDVTEYYESMDELKAKNKDSIYWKTAKERKIRKLPQASIKTVSDLVGSYSEFLSFCAILPAVYKKASAMQREEDEFWVELLKLKKLSETLSVYKDVKSNDASGFSGVLFCLSSITSKINGLEYLSRNDVDIANALEMGKIVIVQSEIVGNEIVGLIFDSTIKELAKRSKKPQKYPISIFVDEAMSIIDKTTELMHNILREAKVEMIIAIQNISQMVSKLGLSKSEEILGSFADKYFYRCDSVVGKNRRDMSVFKNHYYCNEKDGIKRYGEPLFIDQDEIFKAEYEFQSSKSSLEEFRDANVGYIAMFDTLSINNGQIIAQDIIDTQSAKYVNWKSQAQKEALELLRRDVGSKKQAKSAIKLNIRYEIDKLAKLLLYSKDIKKMQEEAETVYSSIDEDYDKLTKITVLPTILKDVLLYVQNTMDIFYNDTNLKYLNRLRQNIEFMRSFFDVMYDEKLEDKSFRQLQELIFVKGVEKALLNDMALLLDDSDEYIKAFKTQKDNAKDLSIKGDVR